MASHLPGRHARHGLSRLGRSPTIGSLATRSPVKPQRLSQPPQYLQRRTFQVHRSLYKEPTTVPPVVSTSSTSPPTSTSTPPPPPPPPPPPRRSLRPVIYSTIFLLVGIIGGQFFTAVVVPPPLPLPDSEDDALTQSRIRKEIDRLPLVQDLRAQSSQWLEYEAYTAQGEQNSQHYSSPSTDSQPSFNLAARDPSSPASRDQHSTSLTAGTMAGSRGIGIQRIFWHRTEQRLISVVFIGGAMCGWPGVTHGGCVATILMEALGRVVSGPEIRHDQRAGVEEGAGSQLGRIGINYKKPTNANMLYVVRAEEDNNSREIKATIENAVTGVVTADATGVREVGVAEKVEEGVRKTGVSVGRWFGLF